MIAFESIADEMARALVLIHAYAALQPAHDSTPSNRDLVDEAAADALESGIIANLKALSGLLEASGWGARYDVATMQRESDGAKRRARRRKAAPA